MRRDASFAEAKSRFGTANPVDLVASGDPVKVRDSFTVLTCWRVLFLTASGDGSGWFTLILRGVRGSRRGFLISTDITLRIIPSRH